MTSKNQKTRCVAPQIMQGFNIIHANEDPAAVVAHTDNATSTTEQNIMASSDDLYGKLPLKLSEMC